MRRKSASTRKNQREKLLDLLDETTDHLNMAELLNQDGRINFSVHAYGETDGIDYNAVKQMKEDGKLAAIDDRREKDIPFRTQGIDFLDFGYFFETKDWKNDILTEEEEEKINDSVAHILKDYGLIVHHDDGANGFGHYAPWYVDGKTPTRLEYGLDEITDLHPYSALREQERCNCAEHADLEIYEDDFIVMECNRCGRTATFVQEGPFEGPRRNPLTEPSHALGAAITATAIGAAFFGIMNMRKR